MESQGGKGILVAGCLPLLLLSGCLGSLVMLGAEDSCSPTDSVTIDDSQLPEDSIGQAAWSGEQLANAAIITNVGADMGMTVRDQTIGVMTAMGESSLQVLDEGDAAGPDSRGLFQQRSNGAWGSYEDRMDPATSAEMFFEAMKDIADRNNMEATLVANAVQNNADPYHYAPYWDDAVEVVAVLSGDDVNLVPVNAQQCAGLAGGGEPQISEDCEPVAEGIHVSSCRAYAALTAEFGEFWDPTGGAHCFREETRGDHPVGQACDYMVAPPGEAPSEAMHEQAVDVIQWLMTHADALDVKYIMYNEAIWNPDQDEYGEWKDVRREEDQYSLANFGGDNTLAHVDHIHLSTGPWHGSNGR